MRWVGQHLCQARKNTRPVCVQGVLQPMQGLYDPHRRSGGPVEAIWCRLAEFDDQVVERDGPPASIGMDSDARRHCIRQTQVVGGRHAVYQHAQLIAACKRIQDG